MEVSFQSQSESNAPIPGGITLVVTLEEADLTQLKEEAASALELERSIPEDARSAFADDDAAYIEDFVRMRATNDALEVRDIIPVAIPHVETSALADGAPYTCYVHVHPRPDIGLTSLDPVDLQTNRIPLPGYSAQAASEGGEAEFVDDDKVLRVMMVDRLDTELSEPAMRALEDEYTTKFELELANRNIDPETYRLAHSLTEEQYALMMARNALGDAHWNYVLDAVFVGNGYTITDDDLLTAFELQFPGYSKQLFELHELRNDMWMFIEKVRRGKALVWLRENILK